jgi:hypothetical protein
MKKTYLLNLLAFSVIVFTGCHFGTSKTWINDHIDPEITNNIKQLNAKLLQDIKNDDTVAVRQLMSKPLIDSAGNKMNTLLGALSKALISTDYDVIGSFYTQNGATDLTTVDYASLINGDSYQVGYIAKNKETYASLISPNTPGKTGIFLIGYGKYDDGWKINIFYAGEYKVLGKTSPEYYQMAKQAYQQGDLLRAADMMQVAAHVAKPLQNYFTYKNDNEMHTFYDKVIKEANSTYRFPITVNTGSTTVQMFGEQPQLVLQKYTPGVYPLIKYKTTLPITDSTTVGHENIALQKQISTVFKDIEKDNAYILYQVYDQVPAGSDINQLKSYSFIQKVK